MWQQTLEGPQFHISAIAKPSTVQLPAILQSNLEGTAELGKTCSWQMKKKVQSSIAPGCQTLQQIPVPCRGLSGQDSVRSGPARLLCQHHFAEPAGAEYGPRWLQRHPFPSQPVPLNRQQAPLPSRFPAQHTRSFRCLSDRVRLPDHVHGSAKDVHKSQCPFVHSSRVGQQHAYAFCGRGTICGFQGHPCSLQKQ